MNVDKNSVLSNKKDTGKNERSGSWSSNPDFNEAMDGWMDTAYQYIVKMKNGMKKLLAELMS